MVASQFTSNPIYNPASDPNVVEFLKLMIVNKPDEEMLENFKQMVTQMPTVNPYMGVLVNPRACEIDLAENILDEIIKDLDDRYNEIVDRGTPYVPTPSPDGGEYPTPPPYNPTPGDIAEKEKWQQEYPGIRDDLGRGKDILEEFRNHTDRIIANFPTIASTVQNSIGLDSILNGINAAPCIPFADVLGSVLDMGRKILDQILGMLAQLQGMVQQALAMIQQAVAMLMNLVNQALAMVMAEIQKLAEMLLNMARMGLAQLMAFLPNDPCLNSLLNGLLTQGANALMSKIR